MQCHSCSVVVAAIVLHVMLQSWEGEDGRVSIGKGGGRWESVTVLLLHKDSVRLVTIKGTWCKERGRGREVATQA